MRTANGITDMTTGTPIKHILSFALPLLVGNLFQQFYNMVDSLVVGNYVGGNALAAVGSCGSLNFLFFSLSSGLGIGIGVIVSQYFGAKDEENVRVTIANAIYVLGVAAVLVSILGVALSPFILRAMDLPETVFPDAVLYIQTTCAGVIAVAAYNGIASILRALGDSRTPLYFLIVSSIINVILDLVFVCVFHMGVFGVAIATIIAQAVSAITCMIYAYKKIPYFHFTKEQLKPKWGIIIRSFRLGVPIALQNSMIAISCMALQGVVNRFGEQVMAAYTITGRVEMIIQQPYGSLSTALTTYTGQNFGAGNKERVIKGFRQATLVALIFSLIMLPIMFLGGRYIAGAFVQEEAIVEIGARALRISSLFYFALGMIYVPRAVMNGCGDAAFAMINGGTEVACRIGYSQIFTRIPLLGYWGIWITTVATWVTTAVVCVWRYWYIKRKI